MNLAFLKRFIRFSFIILIGAFGIFPAKLGAQVALIPASDCGDLGVNCNAGTLSEVIVSLVTSLLVLVGIIAAIFLVYGGLKYILSRGDEKAAAEAKNVIVYTVIGLIVVGLASAIVGFVITVIGTA